MKTRLEELELAKNTWQNAILHLQGKAGDGTSSGLFEEDEDPCDPVPHMSATEIELKLTIYRMCIDWAIREQNTLMDQDDPARDKQRERFYRLMAVLAKAEIDRDDHLHSAVLTANTGRAHPSNQEEVDELEHVAVQALGNLIQTPARPRYAAGI